MVLGTGASSKRRLEFLCERSLRSSLTSLLSASDAPSGISMSLRWHRDAYERFFGHLPILRSALVAVPMKIPRAYLSMEQGGPHLSADVALNSNFLLDFLSYLFLPKPSPPAPPAAPPMPPSFPAPPSSPTTKSADGHDAQSSYYSYGSSEDSARVSALFFRSSAMHAVCLCPEALLRA